MVCPWGGGGWHRNILHHLQSFWDYLAPFSCQKWRCTARLRRSKRSDLLVFWFTCYFLRTLQTSQNCTNAHRLSCSQSKKRCSIVRGSTQCDTGIRLEHVTQIYSLGWHIWLNLQAVPSESPSKHGAHRCLKLAPSSRSHHITGSVTPQDLPAQDPAKELYSPAPDSVPSDKVNQTYVDMKICPAGSREGEILL